MSADHYIEAEVTRLRPQWAQLMANLVLRGWIIRCASMTRDKWGNDPTAGFGSWTAHLQCDTAEQLQVANEHKSYYGLRLYTASSLQELLEQMLPVLAEFQSIEYQLARLPDAAKAANFACHLPPQ